jgi:hypothetical protein
MLAIGNFGRVVDGRGGSIRKLLVRVGFVNLLFHQDTDDDPNDDENDEDDEEAYPALFACSSCRHDSLFCVSQARVMEWESMRRKQIWGD